VERTSSREIPSGLAQLLALDKRLQSSHEPDVAAARKDMERLGLNDAQVKLARHAVNPDWRVRRDLVEALPSIEVVDPREWLTWLSHDDRSEVRRAAISLMATSSDPALRKRVREAADADPNPQIRSQARAALGIRDSRSSVRAGRADTQ
jgi:hypothetical protein